jgi:hypothetical protein
MSQAMLREIAEKLDDWVAAQNAEARLGGWAHLRPCTIKVLGQMALLETGVKLTLAATNDVDVYADYDSSVEKEFGRLLAATGHELDPVGHEIWMPRETRYTELHAGRFVEMLVADSDAVLLSKALKAPARNLPLIVEYLAAGASDRFLKLADKYHLNLEQFL